MISAVILTKNEEKNIVDCLESIMWCNEIIVIDDNSQDRTVGVIKNLKNEKINIFIRPLENDFSAQRNFGLKKAREEWVLFIDADERVTEGLRYEIEYVLSSENLLKQKMRGFYVRRIDVMWEKELRYGETGNVKLLRLAKKGKGMWEGMIHERWKINGNVGELKNPLMHYPHRSISEFLKEINFYTSIKVKELYGQNVHASWFSIIVYPLGKFMLNYFVKKGLLDGIPGLIVAIMMSLHSFLVRSKLWLLWRC